MTNFSEIEKCLLPYLMYKCLLCEDCWNFRVFQENTLLLTCQQKFSMACFFREIFFAENQSAQIAGFCRGGHGAEGAVAERTGGAEEARRRTSGSSRKEILPVFSLGYSAYLNLVFTCRHSRNLLRRSRKHPARSQRYGLRLEPTMLVLEVSIHRDWGYISLEEI